MTFVCQPIDASGGVPAYTAQQSRQAFSGLLFNGTSRPLGAQSGAVPGHTPSITATTTQFTVNAGSFVVDPAFNGTQAPYLVSNDAAYTAAIVSQGVSARIDAIDLQINDNAIDGSGARTASIVYVPGTASAPALTARSVRLATINVPASGGGSPTITMAGQYAVASGGILPVASPTTRDALITNPYPGMTIYVNSLRQQQTYDATLGWVPSYDPTAWTTYAPTWTGESGGGSNLGTGGSITGRYKKSGTNVVGWIRMVIGTGATGPAGIYNWSVPVQAALPVASADIPVGTAGYTGGTYVVGMAKIRYASSGNQIAVRFHGQTDFAQSGNPSSWPATTLFELFFEYESAA